MIERIEQIQAEAAAAIGAATSTASLEELRVRFLGRKAALPNLLRGVAELEPAERGRVGKAANIARQELEGLITDRGAELEAAEELFAWIEDETAAGRPPNCSWPRTHSSASCSPFVIWRRRRRRARKPHG